MSTSKAAISRPLWCRTQAPARRTAIAAPQAWAATQQFRQVDPPPADYDHRQQLRQQSLQLVQQRYPQLTDLVESGMLLVVQRPQDYVERRVDGYREPEEVFLLGTAHVSRRSAEAVMHVVAAVQPEAVVVELCRSRQYLLSAPRSESLNAGSEEQQQQEQERRLPQLPLLFRLDVGAGALLLAGLLTGFYSGVEAEAGVKSGAEFRAAAAAADEAGAMLVLGDRPIELTLQRAWEALSWQERWQLSVDLSRGAAAWWRQQRRAPEPYAQQQPEQQQQQERQAASMLRLDQDSIDKAADDEVVAAMLAQLGERYPGLLRALIHERDHYLAWSLKRSKAVNGASRVVGVVGKAHVRGVCYALSTLDSSKLRFRDLVGGMNNKKARQAQRLRLVVQLVGETVAGLALWQAWEALHG